MEKQIGFIGLGKMGQNMVRRLLEKGWTVTVFDQNPEAMRVVQSLGARVSLGVEELVKSLSAPRLVWIMIPSGKPVDEVIDTLLALLENGDTIIDGGNSFYEDSQVRAKRLKAKRINFLDAGVSGGPGGALKGACIMVGGEEEVYKHHENLFSDLAVAEGYEYMGKAGAGHFVKMVHNGIEYGFMQALAEGFSIMKKSSFRLDLKRIARLYNRGSVIESRLVGWLEDAFEEFGDNLQGISGSVGQTGEGKWTAKTAKKLGVPAPIIKGAVDFRVKSEKAPSFAGKILSALRNQFGGHNIK
ncbi:MAG: decarboxylating 6-phosphogluconate dehydrogenase [Candidatus Wildermuthbacteria bacterium]|nr:decarboxylating 6-phosphogluconate dehydrogenase [Candidatus Wildermuthbacteria bacterium]